MFPGSCKKGGVCFAFPDVCKTPAPPAPFVPIPYPNIGRPASAKKTAADIKFCKKEVVTKKSEEPNSSGDEAGTLKGLVSLKNMDKVKYKKVSSKTKAKGQFSSHFVSATGQNGANANMPAGAQIAPSQTKVILLG